MLLRKLSALLAVLALTSCLPGPETSLMLAGSIVNDPIATTRRIYMPMVIQGGTSQVEVPIPPATNTPPPTATPTFTPTPTNTPRPTRTPVPTVAPSPTPASSDAVLVAAGDIARCGSNGSQQTAALIAKIPGTVAAMGDNAYESGTAGEFLTCYDPTWGAFKNRTYPAVGNHDYITAGAAGYFDYFGAAAGNPTQGYYSYDLGAWHIVVLNSNCGQAGGCSYNLPQEKWLRADLAAHPAKCTLAYWHHPYFSSGEWGNTTWMQTLYTDLYDAGADVVLAGHDHDYERFAPQDPAGVLDPARGVVQFVVGTGGSNTFHLTLPLKPNSLASQASVFGVLKLTLHAASYNWQYIPVSGTFTDSGSAQCH